MIRHNRPKLTIEEKEEISQHYTYGEDIGEILRTFDISMGSMYRVLAERNVPLRNGRARATNETEEQKAIAAEPSEIEEPRILTNQLAVVVDSQDMVQSVHSIKRPGTEVWEVRYTASTLVEANSIEQALAEVKKLATVKRIYMVRLKG
jgi:hypothetical protein